MANTFLTDDLNDLGVPRGDVAQSLSDGQKLQARSNIDALPSTAALAALSFVTGTVTDDNFNALLAALRGEDAAPIAGIIYDATASWWTLPNVVMISSVRAVVGYTKSDGYLYLAEINPTTGFTIGTVQRGTRYTKDDHNSINIGITNLGKLLVIITGHHNPISGQGNSYYEAFLSTTDRIADLPSSAYVMTNTGTTSNYGQRVQNGAFVGNWTNDDSNGSWKMFRSLDSGATFAYGSQCITMGSAPGGGQAQIYSLITPTAAPDICRMLFAPHPTNKSNGTTGMDIRLGQITLSTGVLNGGGADLARNAFSGGGSTPQRSSYAQIYIPAVDYSVRVNDFYAAAGVIACTEFYIPDNSTVTLARHILLVWDGVTNIYTTAAWTKYDIGPAGSSFASDAPQATYLPDIRLARETDYTGVRIYRTWNDGAGNYSLDRITAADYANLAVGGTRTIVTLKTATGGEKLTRIFPAYAGTAAFPGMVGVASSYVTYTDWASNMVAMVEPTG